MKMLRLILFPLSIIYGAAVMIRNFLFDARIIKSYKSPVPVVSVGNVSAGGTGKTPVVIMITELITGIGKSVCVISRGYGRSSKGMTVGFDGKAIKAGAEETGDEMAMIINRFSNLRGKFFAVSDSNRINAVKYAEENFHPDVIILDDAYQHRYVKRDMDIAVVSEEQKGIPDKTLLPAGNLREPISCLCRADLIIRNKKFSGAEISYPMNTVPEIQICYAVEGFFDVNGNRLNISGGEFVSVSGIADNDSFINALNQQGIKTAKDFKFIDHHRYTEVDTEEFSKIAGPNTVFLTTEKDFIKLKNFTNFTEKHRLYFLKIRIVTDERAFLNYLREKNIV